MLRPPPQLTVSEWAERHRMLGSRASAEPGPWRTNRTPYLKDVMDALSAVHPARRVVFMKGAQVGATESGNNWLGYIMHHVPAPTLAVQPTVELAKRFSRQRIDTLLARRVVPLADAVLGRSAAIRRVEATLRRAAGAESPVLLMGETGVGKEVAARLLHAASPRAAGPFIAINCAAIPGELLESEVFGHERGAFTGAGARHAGYAERARDGVLFLDEVGELPLALQPKLLRLLEAREFQRVGGREALPFRARVIAATNADLLARVRQGLFREDLLYRLDVIGVEIPPLRQRAEDILPLAQNFLELGGAQPRRLDAEAEAALLAHGWPGNARELRNRIERASVLADGPCITAADLFPSARPTHAVPLTLAASLEAAERRSIQAALESAEGDVALAAERLGIGRSTLFDKLRRLGLRRTPGEA